MAQSTLGRQMLAALGNVQDLIEVTHDDQRLKELRAQRVQLLKTISDLVDANIQSGTDEYKAATAAIQDASKTIKGAIEGLKAVADAIKSLGDALDLVTGLIP